MHKRSPDSHLRQSYEQLRWKRLRPLGPLDSRPKQRHLRRKNFHFHRVAQGLVRANQARHHHQQARFRGLKDLEARLVPAQRLFLVWVFSLHRCRRR